MNTKEYWQSVREAAAALDPESAALDREQSQMRNERVTSNLDNSQKEIWLISVANENVGTIAGRVCTCVPAVAAKMLKDKTHVLAKPEEIAARKAELASEKVRIERAEADRKGVPTSTLLESIASVLAQQQTQQAAPRRASQ